MNTCKNGLIYFLKTQLMITIVFNTVLAISFILMILLRTLVFNILEKATNQAVNFDAIAYVFLTLPVVVFFACGMYYKQKKKPDEAFARYLPIVFPIIIILFSWLFYTKIYVTDITIDWISMPYTWLYFSPVGFFTFEETNASGYFMAIIFPLITYVCFLAGYIFGEKPFSVKLFEGRKKRFKI